MGGDLAESVVPRACPEPTSGRATDPSSPGVRSGERLVDRVAEGAADVRLGEVHRSQLTPLLDVGLVDVSAEEDDLDLVAIGCRLELLGQLEAVAVREGDVEDGDVGRAVFLDGRDRLLS